MSSAGITNPGPSGLRIYFISGLFCSLAPCSGAAQTSSLLQQSQHHRRRLQRAQVSEEPLAPHCTQIPSPRGTEPTEAAHSSEFYSLGRQELPCSQHRPLSLCFYHLGLGWGCEPWQEMLAYVGMGERRKEKKIYVLKK